MWHCAPIVLSNWVTQPREEVDAVMKQATEASAVIIKPARNTFRAGYAGYFRDPDGHMWEISWNPAFLPPD